MTKLLKVTGANAPATVLVDEHADGVQISYDRMASP
jgi:hypothetical protein